MHLIFPPKTSPAQMLFWTRNVGERQIIIASNNRMHPTRRFAPQWAGVQDQRGFRLGVGFSLTIAPKMASGKLLRFSKVATNDRMPNPQLARRSCDSTESPPNIGST